MSIEKSYTIKIKYSRGDAGLVHEKDGVTITQAALSESDDAYTEIRKIILQRLNDICPVSQGITSAHIVGSVSEA